jgi:hypothetical protein
MKAANHDIKSGFYVKPDAESESIEIVENFEMTNEFKQLVCLPYFKDLYKDLASRGESPQKGITKVSFLNVPHIFNDF